MHTRAQSRTHSQPRHRFVLQGGTSSVYQVKHRETGKIYAMKMIPMERLSKSKRDQLLVEVDIMRKLDHPNIIRIHEVFKTEFTLYIVLEFCTGGELFDDLEKNDHMRMQEDEFREITRTILKALT
jgi:serine/threonine protein kinase